MILVGLVSRALCVATRPHCRYSVTIAKSSGTLPKTVLRETQRRSAEFLSLCGALVYVGAAPCVTLCARASGGELPGCAG